MKLTKATLKQIIKEELAKMTEIADTQVDPNTGGIRATPGAGLSPEAEAAIEGLKEMGIVAANGELGWNTVPDVVDGLAKMRVDSDTFGEVVAHFHALTR